MPRVKNNAQKKAETITKKSVKEPPKAVSKIPEDEKMNFELEEAKDIIDDFIKQCAHLPGCLAHAMRVLSNEYFARIHTSISQDKMTPDEIIEDAEVIFATMRKLRKDFTNEHDHANAVFDEILGHYVPNLQKALRQISEDNSAVSEADSDCDQELEKSKEIIAKFVKTCSLNPNSKRSALIDLTNEYFGQRLFQSNQKTVSPDTIIADADKIMVIMEKLMSNYSAGEQQAYKVMDEILARYVPDLKIVMEYNMKNKK